MHVPSGESQTIELLSFDEALTLSGRSGGYDADKWLYVPDFYTEYRYILGVRGSSSYRVKVGAAAFGYAFHEVGYWIRSVIGGLRMMVSGQVGLQDLSGPVGVVEVIGDTYEESKEDGAIYIIWNLMNIAILLSANLGVINLLPLPALDGGRLVFLVIEAIRGRRMDQRIEGRVHFAGLMLLMALMIVVLFSDVGKLIR